MGIVKGIQAIIDFLQAGFDYLKGVVSDSFEVFSKLPDFYFSARSLINNLPSIFITIGMFCLSVRTLVMIIHAKAGE